MKFQLESNQLTITLEGAEQIWALKRRLQIPHYAISEVDYQVQMPSMREYRGYTRIPGASIPWYFLAGSYRHGKVREFCYIKMRQAGVLLLHLKPGTLNYDKIRLTCPPEIAQSIADWWQARK